MCLRLMCSVLGGFRASIYNSVLIDDVRALVTFITEFERIHSSAHIATTASIGAPILSL